MNFNRLLNLLIPLTMVLVAPSGIVADQPTQEQIDIVKNLILNRLGLTEPPVKPTYNNVDSAPSGQLSSFIALGGRFIFQRY